MQPLSFALARTSASRSLDEQSSSTEYEMGYLALLLGNMSLNAVVVMG